MLVLVLVELVIKHCRPEPNAQPHGGEHLVHDHVGTLEVVRGDEIDGRPASVGIFMAAIVAD